MDTLLTNDCSCPLRYDSPHRGRPRVNTVRSSLSADVLNAKRDEKEERAGKARTFYNVRIIKKEGVIVMQSIKKMQKFIELSKWFNRKSQHYILGNWLRYVSSWDYEKGAWNKEYFRYLRGYPGAWCSFMWYSRHDIFMQNR